MTQFAALIAGGNIGDDIVPGRSDMSSIMELIEGRRGPRQRMPQDSPPLSSSEIELMRRWIDEGAHNDQAELPCFELQIPRIALSSSAPVEISARISSPAFLTLTLRSSPPLRDLYIEEASVNSPRERANIAAPGEWIRWRITREQDWPHLTSLILRIQYAAGGLDGSVLIARTARTGEQRLSKPVTMSCVPL